MTSFNISQLKKLCHIDLSSKEEEELEKSLAAILKSMHDLSNIDTESVEPCRFISKVVMKNQMREDVVGEVLTREQFLSNAPDQIGGMIRIPSILKN